jgi:hypothetical protein
MFRRQTHQNALCDPQIPPNAKTQVWCDVSRVLLLGSTSGPHELEKWYVDISRPGGTKTLYMTNIPNQMQKHEFGITCPCMLLF